MTTPFRLLLAWSLFVSLAYGGSYQYIRIGNKEDVQPKTIAGIAMLGGGSDLDEAFRWLCEKSKGGDFLVLRATGDDDYNSYVNGLCKLNSVATLIIPTREAAQEPGVDNTPLTFRDITVYRAPSGSEFNLKEWKGKGGTSYSLSVVAGQIQSTQAHGEVY